MKVIGGAFQAIGLIPKMPKPAPAIRPVTRDDARDAALKEDDLMGRRGSLNDVVTGTGGAEAGRTGKALLG